MKSICTQNPCKRPKGSQGSKRVYFGQCQARVQEGRLRPLLSNSIVSRASSRFFSDTLLQNLQKVPIYWQAQGFAGPFGHISGPIHPAGDRVMRYIRSR
jgi:hypothetical protein